MRADTRVLARAGRASRSDSSYELGDGTTIDKAIPERVFPPFGVFYQTLASSGSISYAISTAGDVYAWGRNVLGEVGDGTKKTAEDPVLVYSHATSISATANDVVVAGGG